MKDTWIWKFFPCEGSQDKRHRVVVRETEESVSHKCENCQLSRWEAKDKKND